MPNQFQALNDLSDLRIRQQAESDASAASQVNTQRMQGLVSDEQVNRDRLAQSRQGQSDAYDASFGPNAGLPDPTTPPAPAPGQAVGQATSAPPGTGLPPGSTDAPPPAATAPVASVPSAPIAPSTGGIPPAPFVPQTLANHDASKIPAGVQQGRDAQRIPILQRELQTAMQQHTPNAPGDVAALTAELRSLGATPGTPAPAYPATSPLPDGATLPAGAAPTAAAGPAAGLPSSAAVSPQPPTVALDASKAAPAPGSTFLQRTAAQEQALAATAAKSGTQADVNTHLANAHSAQWQDAVNRGILSSASAPQALMNVANGQPGNPSAPGSPHMSIGQKSVDKDGQPTGYAVTVIEPNGTGQSFDVSAADLAQVAGYSAAMNIDPEKSLAGIASVNVHLATLFATKLKSTLDVQAANTDTNYKQQIGDAKGVWADAAQARADAMQSRAQAEMTLAAATRARIGAPVQTVDAQNNAHTLTPVLNNGQVTYAEAPLPPGQHFLKQLPNQPAVEARAQALYNTPTGQLVNGQPQMYTQETAYAAAYQQVQAGNSGAPAANGIDPNVLTRMRANAAKATNPQGTAPQASVAAPGAAGAPGGAGLPTSMGRPPMIASSRDPISGATTWTVAGMRGRFASQAQAAAALQQSGMRTAPPGLPPFANGG